MRILKVQFSGSHFLTSLLVGVCLDLERGIRLCGGSCVWSQSCVGHQRWRGRGNSSLCAIYNLESSWVHSVVSYWIMELCNQGQWVWVQVQLAPLPENISSQKSPEALLLRPTEDMCSPSTCQGRGTMEISGCDLGAVHAAPSTAAPLDRLPRVCMFYLVQDIRWHPSWKEVGGSMEGSKVFWNP